METVARWIAFQTNPRLVLAGMNNIYLLMEACSFMVLFLIFGEGTRTAGGTFRWGGRGGHCKIRWEDAKPRKSSELEFLTAEIDDCLSLTKKESLFL